MLQGESNVRRPREFNSNGIFILSPNQDLASGSLRAPVQATGASGFDSSTESPSVSWNPRKRVRGVDREEFLAPKRRAVVIQELEPMLPAKTVFESKLDAIAESHSMGFHEPLARRRQGWCGL